MNIHQVCVTYVNEQDRLLLRLNTRGQEEIRLWFTRRLTLGLLPLMEKAAAEQLAQKIPATDATAPLEQQRQRLLDAFSQEAATYDGDYQTPYQDADKLPLGAEPLLVTEVKMTPLASGHIQLEMLEKLAGQCRNLDLKMDTQLSRGLLQLLNQALTASQWLAVSVRVNVQAGALDAGAHSLGSAVEKPRYLN